MQVCTVLEDVNAEVATGFYMNSIGCPQVPPPASLYTAYVSVYELPAMQF